MKFQSQEDTIVARATPPGEGAIAIVRVSGKKAISICNQLFPAKDLEEQAGHTLHFGTIQLNGVLIDEVVLSLFRGSSSYTGENTIEISCHGSDFIVQQITEAIIQLGARYAQPGEFTLRAFLNGKMDLSEAEAVADLIASDSKASHRVAMNQMRGGFSSEIKKLRDELVQFASLLELELDFSEEDVEFASRDDLKESLQKMKHMLSSLIESFRLGNVMKNGISVAIIGKPNTGKSTLLNALLNEDKAIVSDIAGTTRDAIEDEMILEDIRFRFVDTAGIRETQDAIEAIGVKKSLEKMHQAAIILYLFDASKESLGKAQKEITQATKDVVEHAHVVIVANKTDLLKNKVTGQEKDVIHISAKAGTGMDELIKKLIEKAKAGSSAENDVLVTNARHLEALTQSNTSITNALNGLETGITGDFVAMDIRQALHHLGEITGEITTDDLLGNIFSQFCIGK